MIFLALELAVDVTGDWICHLSNRRPSFFNSELSYRVKSRLLPLCCLMTMTFLRYCLVSVSSSVLSSSPWTKVPYDLMSAGICLLAYRSCFLWACSIFFWMAWIMLSLLLFARTSRRSWICFWIIILSSLRSFVSFSTSLYYVSIELISLSICCLTSLLRLCALPTVYRTYSYV